MRSSLLQSTIVLVTLLFLCTACSRKIDSPAELEGVRDDYPRVDGSTSTQPLAVLIACKAYGVPYTWQTPLGAERTVFPDELSRPRLARRIEEMSVHSGTHGSTMRLIEGQADLILVARPPSMEELAAARSRGVVLDARPVALDGLVFVVNASNPVGNLTLEQVRAIFSPPPVRDWSELGGPERPLQAFQRNPTSGSQELMIRLVMGDRPMLSPELAPAVLTMAGAVNIVATHPEGISFSVYYYVRNMAPNPAAKMIAIDGVMPDSESIASRAYPLTTEVYSIVRDSTPSGDPALVLRDWLLSEEGQRTIAEAGYAPLDEASSLQGAVRPSYITATPPRGSPGRPR